MNAELLGRANTGAQLDRDLYCLRSSGFLVLRNFVELRTVELIKRTALAFAREVDDYVNARNAADRSYNWPLRYTRCLYAVSEEIQELAMDARIRALTQGYLGEAILRDCLLQTNMPEIDIAAWGGSGPLSYHRDTLWPTDHIAPMYLHVFLVLDDFTTSNGATVIVPGSHQEREPGYYFKDTDPRKPVDGIKYRVYERGYFGSSIALEAPRGSIIFLDPMGIHTQGNNLTSHTRSLVNMTHRAADVAGLPPLLNARAIAERHARVPVRRDFLQILENDSKLPEYFGPLGGEHETL